MGVAPKEYPTLTQADRKHMSILSLAPPPRHGTLFSRSHRNRCFLKYHGNDHDSAHGIGRPKPLSAFVPLFPTLFC